MRSARTRIAGWILTLPALAACSPPSPSVAATEFASAVAASSQLGYVAVRRYTSFASGTASSYVERIIRTSDGKSKVELIALDGKTLDEITDPAALDQFHKMQALLNGGRGKFVAVSRDFFVRDASAFLANYSWNVLSEEQPFEGRSCVVAAIQPVFLDRPHYTIWVDLDTHLTLKYLEFLPTGALIAEMETLEIDYDFDMSGVDFPDSAATPPVVIEASQVPSFVSWKAFTPVYLPAGFVLGTVRVSTIASHPLIAWSYTDGIQELFVAQYAELGTPEAAPPLGYPADAPTHIRLNVLGAHLESRFVIDGTQLHLSGKVEPEELMSMIESLQPIEGT